MIHVKLQRWRLVVSTETSLEALGEAGKSWSSWPSRSAKNWNDACNTEMNYRLKQSQRIVKTEVAEWIVWSILPFCNRNGSDFHDFQQKPHPELMIQRCRQFPLASFPRPNRTNPGVQATWYSSQDVQKCWKNRSRPSRADRRKRLAWPALVAWFPGWKLCWNGIGVQPLRKFWVWRASS